MDVSDNPETVTYTSVIGATPEVETSTVVKGPNHNPRNVSRPTSVLDAEQPAEIVPVVRLHRHSPAQFHRIADVAGQCRQVGNSRRFASLGHTLSNIDEPPALSTALIANQ